MNTEHATPDLFQAMSLAQGEIENATKNAKNPHYKSSYADLSEILNTVRPVFAKHGLTVIQSTGFDGSMVNVECIIAHKSGGWISSTSACVPAKTDAQGVGAATTYLRRYSLAAMAGISQEDDDGQSASHTAKPIQWISEEQAATLQSLIEETGADEGKFLKYMQADSIKGIRASSYQQAVKALERKRSA